MIALMQYAIQSVSVCLSGHCEAFEASDQVGHAQKLLGASIHRLARQESLCFINFQCQSNSNWFSTDVETVTKVVIHHKPRWLIETKIDSEVPLG
jgi:hypothetical protein